MGARQLRKNRHSSSFSSVHILNNLFPASLGDERHGWRRSNSRSSSRSSGRSTRSFLALDFHTVCRSLLFLRVHDAKLAQCAQASSFFKCTRSVSAASRSGPQEIAHLHPSFIYAPSLQVLSRLLLFKEVAQVRQEELWIVIIDSSTEVSMVVRRTTRSTTFRR